METDAAPWVQATQQELAEKEAALAAQLELENQLQVCACHSASPGSVLHTLKLCCCGAQSARQVAAVQEGRLAQLKQELQVRVVFVRIQPCQRTCL